MRLLAYFSKYCCDAMREIHLENKPHKFLSALARFHIYHSGPSGLDWGWMGKTSGKFNKPSTDWKHIILPFEETPCFKCYQRYVLILMGRCKVFKLHIISYPPPLPPFIGLCMINYLIGQNSPILKSWNWIKTKTEKHISV